MRKPATGEPTRGWYANRIGVRYVHIPLGKGKRKSTRLAVKTDEAADARAALVREIATKLLAAGQTADALEWAKKAATTEDEERARKILGYARALAKGEAKKAGEPEGDIVTFKRIGQDWTAGRLAQKYPDSVPLKRTVVVDVSRLEWLYKTGGLGDLPITAFRIEHAEAAMAKLDRKLRPATRRQYAQLIRRVLEMCVWPLRILPANPIPRGFLPKPRQDRALMCLYPEEEATYLGHRETPLVERVACGFLARMGFRKSEVIGSDPDDDDPAPPLAWDRVDLKRGVVHMARSKTEKPRPVALPPDVVRALEAWRKVHPKNRIVFAGADDVPIALEARVYRAHLRTAGVTRAELHAEGRKDTVALRVHDLRALFTTVSIAQGRPDYWIRDRTAHKTLSMLDRYRRQARMFEELNLGPLAPLDQTIPELAAAVAEASHGGNDGEGSATIVPPEALENLADPLRACTGRQPFESAASTVPPLRPSG
jgi:integrase